MGKIQILQLLRGIAAVGIVYFHTEYGPWENANWGVKFFFTLSALVMMMSTENKEQNRKNVKGYWLPKLIKIYPLYLIMTCVVTGANIIYPSAFRTTQVSVGNFVKSLLLIPAWALEGRVQPIYSVCWTLYLEMIFYILFFFAWRISHKFRGIVTGVICLALNIFCVICRSQNWFGDSAVIELLGGKSILCFVVGIILYYISKDKIKNHYTYVTYVFIAACCLMLFGQPYFFNCDGIVAWLLTQVWCSILIFGAMVLGGEIKPPKWLVLIGDASYSIYLTHFMIVGLVCRIFMKNKMVNVRNTILVVVTVLICILVGVITYYVVEVRIGQILKQKLLKR